MRKMVKVILGGIFCTSTVTVSDVLSSRLPRTIVTKAVALGNATSIPLGTSGNCKMVVGGNEASTCTVEANLPSAISCCTCCAFALTTCFVVAVEAADAVLNGILIVKSKMVSSTEPLIDKALRRCSKNIQTSFLQERPRTLEMSVRRSWLGGQHAVEGCHHRTASL